MQITDLVKPMDQCTDEELLARLRTIRANRTTIRPAGKARAKRAEKKGSQGRVNKLEALLNGLSEADKLALLAELGEG
jgi:hypothetical protein